MTITLYLTPEQEELLKTEADREGVSPEVYALHRVLGKGLLTPDSPHVVAPGNRPHLNLISASDPVTDFEHWIRGNGHDKAPPIPLDLSITRTRPKLLENCLLKAMIY